MPARITLALCGLMAASTAALAADAGSGVEVKRNGAPNAPFSSSVWAGDLLFLSGTLGETKVPEGAPAGTPATVVGDTAAQTRSVLTRIQKSLEEQGLTLGDVVQMNVFLAGDSKLDGKMDFNGMNTVYREFFGTAAQPNKPARSTVQVAALALGALVEIDVVAARPKKH
ncbi:MAG: RidA family protein [Steroidobacteraceae bacterium]